MKIQVNNIHSVNSLSLIKLLKDLKSDRIEVVGSDVLPKGEYAGSLLVDKYYIAPPVSEENNYLAFLNYVFQKERIDLLIPASDAEALFLSKYKEKIDVPFFLADESTVKFFKDKLICSQKLSEQGVLVPPIITDLRNENKIIFRKRVSVNSQGIYIVDLSKETYIKNYFNNDYFIQKYIDGETFIVDVLSDINGVPHIIIPRKTIEVKDGTAYRSQIVYEEQLINLTKRICAMYKLPGFCNMDFKKKNNKFYFIENNVRFAGSGIFSAIASFNYLKVYIDHFVKGIDMAPWEYYSEKVAWGSIITRYFSESKYVPE